MALVFAVKAIATILQEKISARLSNQILTDIRRQLFEEELNSDINFTTKKGAGKLSSILLGDVQLLDDMFQNGIFLFFSSLIMTLIFLFALLFIHFQLALISFATVPVFLYFFVKLHRSIKSNTIKTRKATAKLNAFFIESTDMLSTIRLNLLENIFLKRQKRLNNALCRSLLQQKVKQSTFSALAYFCFTLSFVITLAYSAFLAISGKLTTGDLLAFYIILQGLFQPLMSVFISFRSIQKGTAVLERIETFRDEMQKAKKPKKAFRVSRAKHFSHKKDLAIETTNLSFSYNGKKAVNNVNMEIKKGEKILIIGLNGSGKSTLIKLFTKLFTPDSGDIFILGKNITDWSSEGLSAIFSVIEQDKHTFSGSFRENIDPTNKLSSSDFKHLLKQFRMDKPFLRKPVISSQGSNLSTGERQRVAVIRGLFKKTPLYIFDEAFSSQDTACSSFLYSFLKNLPKEKTFIGITHQLSTAPFVDKIFLLKKGAVAEYGHHNELLAKKGEYNDLYTLYTHENNKKTSKITVF